MFSHAAENPAPKAVALFTNRRHTIFVEVEWDGCGHGVGKPCVIIQFWSSWLQYS